MSHQFVTPPIFPVFSIAEAHTPVHRLARASLTKENYKYLTPKHVQSVVDQHIIVTYQHLQEQVNQYNGLNATLRDSIVPLVFTTSSHALLGKGFPVNDLFEPFKLFDDNFHLFLAGVPKAPMKGPVNALDEMITIVEERYLSKPNALDDASTMIREYERMAKGRGFVSRSPPHAHTRAVLRVLTDCWTEQ